MTVVKSYELQIGRIVDVNLNGIAVLVSYTKKSAKIVQKLRYIYNLYNIVFGIYLEIMIRSQKSHDLELAYNLYQQEHCFGLTENAVLPRDKDKKNYKPRTLIDQTLELIDPTPNIHTLFVQFNERYFWNVLLPVEVKWSPRMTSCAGVCSFHPRNRQCIISLSAPLLKLRPRKDLVETLLHEMIHGYLFLTNNNRDRDGHGPEFCKHMDRINKIAGTKITIYHTFHDEVKLYQQHWWRCNGPCQKRAPYFGTVRRAMNRTPGPSDFWWKEHQQTCGGQFIKIKEPENFKARGSKNKEKTKPPPKNNGSPSNVYTWLTRTPPPITELKTVFTPKSTKIQSTKQNSLNGHIEFGSPTNKAPVWGVGGLGSSSNSQKQNSPGRMPATKIISSSIAASKSVSMVKNTKPVPNNRSPSTGLVKLGNSTNNVHGWGTGGPGSSSTSVKYGSPSTQCASPRSSSSTVLGGSNTGQSNLLNKLYIDSPPQGLNKYTATNKSTDTAKTKKPIINNKSSLNEEQIKLVECPICSNFVSNDDINTHVDSCLVTNDKPDETERGIATNSYNSPLSQKRKNDANLFSSKQPKLNEFENSRKANCPICSKNFDFSDINEHLDACLSGTDKKGSNSILNLVDINCGNEDINDSIISLSSTSSDLSPSPKTDNLKNPTNSVQKTHLINNDLHNCLVCNILIPCGTSLNDHLEDCVGNIFNDEYVEENVETSDMVQQISIDDNDKYPCPVCMQLITVSAMNQHLDSCLPNT